MTGTFASLRGIVHGRVQGVFFRGFTSRRAMGLGLTGYVRNLPDRTVEIRAEGEREKLEELIKHLESGPPGAMVEKVETIWAGYTGGYSSFSIRY